MKTIKSVLFVFTLLFSFTNYSYCQINAYLFSTATGTALEDMSSGTTTIVAGGQDDGVSAVTNIGFTFNYNCTSSYTQFSANSNGLMRLGGTVVSNAYSNSLANGSDDPKIAPMWDDLSTATVASGGKVHYKLFGSAPNRYLVVEWRTYHTSSTASAYTMTFQAHLYETTDVIKFVYGTLTPSDDCSIGITSSSTDFHSVTASSNTTSTTTANDINSYAILSGRSYSFTPPSGTGAMAYVSSVTLTASVDPVTKCVPGQAIIAVKVTTTGCSAALNLTQFQFNMTGSTNGVGDVDEIHIYYTGGSGVYEQTNAFDGAGTVPAGGTITVNGSQTLVGGENYFWIAYDMNSGSTTNNVVDAQCTQITVGGVNQTPSVTAPAGNRQIDVCPNVLIASYPSTADLADATTNYANMTLTGTATGPSASGLCLDGTFTTSDYHTPLLTGLNPDNFQIDVDFSMNSFGHPIVVGGMSFRWIELKVNASGYMAVSYNNGTILTSTKLISLNTYYTAKLMYSTGTLQLYLDDILIFSSTSLPSPLTHGNDKYFYGTNYSNGTALDGCVRNLKIYNFPSITDPISLPVTLLSFTVEELDENNLLKWVTATETHNDFFTVEKTGDGKEYNSVGNRKGAGTTVEQQEYQMIDYDVYKIINYYRLRQTDFDGNYTFSDLISIDNSEKNKDVILITNILGQEVDESFRGLIIIVYSDGSSKKVIQ